MKKEYQAFIEDLSQVTDGVEVELNIKDLTPGPYKYDSRLVKAILFSSPERLPEGDILWLRSYSGFLHPKPWAMKITRELGDYVPVPPYSDVRDDAGI